MTVESYARLAKAMYAAHRKRSVHGITRYWRGPELELLPWE